MCPRERERDDYNLPRPQLSFSGFSGERGLACSCGPIRVASFRRYESVVTFSLQNMSQSAIKRNGISKFGIRKSFDKTDGAKGNWPLSYLNDRKAVSRMNQSSSSLLSLRHFLLPSSSVQSFSSSLVSSRRYKPNRPWRRSRPCIFTTWAIDR
jgi:hypothetical protein